MLTAQCSECGARDDYCFLECRPSRERNGFAKHDRLPMVKSPMHDLIQNYCHPDKSASIAEQVLLIPKKHRVLITEVIGIINSVLGVRLHYLIRIPAEPLVW